jgi:hypothetical protein
MREFFYIPLGSITDTSLSSSGESGCDPREISRTLIDKLRVGNVMLEES